MKALKFLLFFLIIVLLILLFLTPFYYSDVATLMSDISEGKQTTASAYAKFKEMFAHADSWNALGLLFLAASIMMMHSIVDHFILFRLNKFYTGKFTLDGMLWMGKRLLSLLFTTLVFVFMTNMMVDFYSNIRIAGTTDDLHDSKYTVLLLGTNKFLQDGVSENVYFTERINAVVKLYEKGVISTILVSGDNGKEGYNEPQDMAQSLIRRGIPKSMIKMDFAGFRTLDSIVRSKQLFGYQRLLVVSQGFHLQRALFLAWYFGVDAYGFEAKGNLNIAMFMRENLAVPKMILDILVLNTQPKYGSTGVRRALTFGQTDLILISFIFLYFGAAAYLSYDAFKFGE